MSPTKTHSNNDYRFYDEKHKGIWKRGISRKIGESDFVQQKLPAYRLEWNPLRVGPFIMIMGACFLALGVGIKKFSDQVGEVKVLYTHCTSLEHPSKTCYDLLEEANANSSLPGMPGKIKDASEIENCTCLVNFQLNETLKGTIYIYYALTNFYQNHREHYLSRDENQLKGQLFKKDGTPRDPSTYCKPLARGNENKIIYPCGLMANSMFTDVIDLFYNPRIDILHFMETQTTPRNDECIHYFVQFVQSQAPGLLVPVIKTGIAWESDKEDKYRHPDGFGNRDDPIWTNFTKPWSWKRTLWELDPLPDNNNSNNGVRNEDFIVWMRTAAFPWFRKMYRIVDSNCPPYEEGLPPGNYSLRIQYNYDVSSFKGEKEIIISTTSMVGGKNMFLAIVYFSAGGLCLFLGLVLISVYYCTKHYHRSQGIKQD